MNFIHLKSIQFCSIGSEINVFFKMGHWYSRIYQTAPTKEMAIKWAYPSSDILQ